MRLMGLFALIPISVLLTISYFVLIVNRKQDDKNLKTFGLVVAVLLCIAAGVICAGGTYALITGKHPMMGMMKHMMKDVCGPMMKGQMQCGQMQNTPMR